MYVKSFHFANMGEREGFVGAFGLLAMGIFLAILVVGFIYEWKKGALEWD